MRPRVSRHVNKSIPMVPHPPTLAFALDEVDEPKYVFMSNLPLVSVVTPNNDVRKEAPAVHAPAQNMNMALMRCAHTELEILTASKLNSQRTLIILLFVIKYKFL